MRLIDADAFIEYVNRRFDLCSDELRMMIEEQPTAYDVEEVVEDLDLYITKIVGRKSMLYQKIMEKVRKGGVE